MPQLRLSFVIVAGVVLACSEPGAVEKARAREAAANVAAANETPEARRRAIALHEQARDAWRRAGDVAGQARAQAAIGEHRSMLYEDDAAKAAREEAAALYARAGDAEGELRVRVAMIGDGDLEGEARLAAFAAMIEQARTRKAAVAELDATIGHARVLADLGRGPEALTALRDLAPRVAAAGDAVLSVEHPRQFGIAYYNAGDSTRALEQYAAARAAAVAAGRDLDVAQLDGLKGMLELYLLEQWDPARATLEKALVELERLGDRSSVWKVRESLGDLLINVEDFAAAIAALEPHAASVRALGEPGELGRALCSLADAYRWAKRPDDSRTTYQEALAISDRHPDPILMETALIGLARNEIGAGQWAAARAAAERFIASVSARERAQPEERLRLSYTAATRAGQTVLVETYAREGDAERAFVVSEAMRGRYLIGEMTGTPGKPGATITAVAEAQAALDADTALVEYVFAVENVFAFVLDRRGLVVRNLGPRTPIIISASKLYKLLARPDAPAADVAAAQTELAGLIVAPLAADLTAPRLAIAADLLLTWLPMAPLPLPDGATLASRFELIHVTSASVMRVQRQAPPRPRPARALAILADPVSTRRTRRRTARRRRRRHAPARRRPRRAVRLPDVGGDHVRRRGHQRPDSLVPADRRAAGRLVDVAGRRRRGRRTDDPLLPRPPARPPRPRDRAPPRPARARRRPALRRAPPLGRVRDPRPSDRSPLIPSRAATYSPPAGRRDARRSAVSSTIGMAIEPEPRHTETFPLPGVERGATPPGTDAGADETGERHYLVVFHEDSSAMVPLPRSGDVVIGRSDAAELRLADPGVSRSHARLTMLGGEARLADLGSQNGTLVNGERIVGARLLASADVITICRTTLVYHSSRRGHAKRVFLDGAELRNRVTHEVERALRYDRFLSLIVIDVGPRGQSPLAADRPRIEAALRGRLRSIDLVGWATSTQLWVLLPESDGDDAALVGERLVADLQPIAPGSRIGFATCPTEGCDVDTIAASARSAAEGAQPGACVAAARSYTTLQVGEHAVIVADPAMTRVYALIERLAPSELPVLVWGETGTGKELAAAAVHHWSRRAPRPLVTLNCAAIPEQLVESALFGHEKGAFTGADSAKPGLFESAAGGTVFLDETGELSLAVQAKLLRTLETGTVTRVGGVTELDVDFRIVAATNRDLVKEVAAGRFRADLYFRLSGAMLWLPPLRDRPREVPILAAAFLARACERAKRAPLSFSAPAMRMLARHQWPGNVRELRNVVEFVVATAEDAVVEPAHFAGRLGGAAEDAETDAEPAGPRAARGERAFRPIADEVRELEVTRMKEALAACRGNRTHAAALIQMPVRTFLTKLKKYRLG